MSHIPRVPDVDVRAKLAQVEGLDVKSSGAHDIRQRVLKRHVEGKELVGLRLPWSKTHDKVALRPGGVSVWAGYNGHFKSTILAQVSTWAAQFARVGVCSFEMELEDTYNLMAMQAGGTHQPDTRWVNDFCTWADGRVYVYDRLESVPSRQVCAAIDHMAGTLDCGLVVVDSISLVRGVIDDPEQERDFMTLMCGLAKYHHTHIALVHHMRKPQQGDERHIPGKYDLRGSAAISDLADAVFISWSNKELRDLRRKADAGWTLTADENARYTKLADEPEHLLKVVKNRHAPFEGAIALWQHTSRQFTATSRRQAAHIDIPRLEATA